MNTLSLFGDSVLKGVTQNPDTGKYCLCRRDWSDLEKKSVKVNNFTHMGATITKGVSLLERAEPQPHGTIVLEYGGNDCDFDWGAVSADPGKDFLPHTPENEFIALYRKAIRLAKEKAQSVMVLSLVPIDAGKFFSFITKENGQENILSFLGDVSMLSRWQELYSHLVEQVAREEQCPFIDIRQVFLRRHDFPRLLCADGIHPTPLGHEIITREIISAVSL